MVNTKDAVRVSNQHISYKIHTFSLSAVLRGSFSGNAIGDWGGGLKLWKN